MGAVAGMSGSPLYIDGRFAGALSYQMQHFETVRFAGFTPAADMEEVAERVAQAAGPPRPAGSDDRPRPAARLRIRLPRHEARVRPGRRLPEDGLDHGAPLRVARTRGGPSAAAPGQGPQQARRGGLPSSPATRCLWRSPRATSRSRAPALCRASTEPGRRVGHPMLGLGDVQLPMCSAEVVAILPSTMESFKIANIGPVIGCISQDRLSAVSGLLGPGPEMTDVEVVAGRAGRRAGRSISRSCATSASRR